MATQRDEFYYTGIELLKNPKKTKKGLAAMLKSVEKFDNPKSKYILGLLFLNGYGNVKEDKAKSDKYLEDAYEGLLREKDEGDILSSRFLATYHVNGYYPHEVDAERAIEYYAFSAEQGDVESASYLGHYYSELGDVEKASKYFSMINIDNESVVAGDNVESSPILTEETSVTPLVEEDKKVETKVENNVFEENLEIKAENEFFESEKIFLQARQMSMQKEEIDVSQEELNSMYKSAYQFIKSQASNSSNPVRFKKYLAIYYFEGLEPCSQDYERALKLYSDVAYSGDYDIARFLAKYYEQEEKDAEKAYKYYRLAEDIRMNRKDLQRLERDDSVFKGLIEKHERNNETTFDAIYKLRDEKLSLDQYKAIKKVLSEQAEDNDVDSILLMAYLYRNGHKFEKADNSKAYSYYMMAANLGSPKGLYHQGIMVLSDENEDYFDRQRGIELISEAAQKGVPEALDRMGILYRNGRYVDKDNAKAEEFFVLAGNRGYGVAFYHLYLMYTEKGDTVKAQEAYTAAIANGYSKNRKENYLLGCKISDYEL